MQSAFKKILFSLVSLFLGHALVFAASSPHLALTANPSAQYNERDDFVKANVLWIFYHEMAHALIHQLELPVLGKEEDAADHLAILLSDELWDEEQADQINSYASSAFWVAGKTAEEPAPWWDEHSTDQQRHFTVACLYYGGDPEGRKNVIEAVGIPTERAELCIQERELLNYSWGGVLDQLANPKNEYSHKLKFENRSSLAKRTATTELIVKALADEVTALNQHFSLPSQLALVVMDCGEENVFYDLDKKEIQICSEYSNFLDRLYHY